MKNEVLYLLLNNYADHEAVFLASAIACDERSIKENPKYTNKVVAPTLDVVRSCSGFHTLPDYSFETMPNDYAALVLSKHSASCVFFSPLFLPTFVASL